MSRKKGQWVWTWGRSFSVFVGPDEVARRLHRFWVETDDKVTWVGDRYRIERSGKLIAEAIAP